MDAHQDIDTWQAELAGRPRVFNHNPRLRAAEFRGFDLVNEVAMAAPNGAVEQVYLFARRGAVGETLLRVGVCAHDDTRHALLALRDALEHSMNPAIPRAGGVLGKLADIGFAARSEAGNDRNPALDAASFNVGNVVVTVQSAGTAALDVSAAALQLGRLLAAVPGKPALRSGRATSFAPAGVELRAGQTLTLVEQLPEARPGADRVQLIAPDGEFRRDGQALVYVARVSGPQRVALFTHTQAQV